ncbi:hypothetical protein BDR03DRAFT_1027750 [Suillus americanus]|nr:hypothetical protein BDR03DRAFT_1027750 [Suillus americanus]
MPFLVPRDWQRTIIPRHGMPSEDRGPTCMVVKTYPLNVPLDALGHFTAPGISTLRVESSVNQTSSSFFSTRNKLASAIRVFLCLGAAWGRNNFLATEEVLASVRSDKRKRNEVEDEDEKEKKYLLLLDTLLGNAPVVFSINYSIEGSVPVEGSSISLGGYGNKVIDSGGGDEESAPTRETVKPDIRSSQQGVEVMYFVPECVVERGPEIQYAELLPGADNSEQPCKAMFNSVTELVWSGCTLSSSHTTSSVTASWSTSFPIAVISNSILD